MKLGDLAQSIKQGIVVEVSNLTNVPTNYLYLQAQNIKSGFVTEENAKYILEKTGKKYIKADMLEYGDILVYHKDGQFFDIFRFTQDFTKKIIPSPAFAIIKAANSFLTNILQLESGKSYVKSELEEVENDWEKFIIYLKNIHIPKHFEYKYLTTKPVSIEDVQKMECRISNVSIYSVIDLVKHNDLILEKVIKEEEWDLGTKSRFIETLILGLPTPTLYFISSDDYKLEVLDGVKRINAIVSFIENEFSLCQLAILDELAEKRFQDLERSLLRRLMQSTLMIYDIMPGTPQNVKHQIYKNINFWKHS